MYLFKPIVMTAGFLSFLFGVWLVKAPKKAIEFQIAFYRHINWRMEPLDWKTGDPQYSRDGLDGGRLRSGDDGVDPPVTEDIIHKIIRSSRRTLALEITPDAALVVRAPYKASLRMIQDAVQEKLPWILKKQRLMRRRAEMNAQKEALAEEGLLYLGEAGDIPAASGGKEALVSWYKEQAAEVLAERVSHFTKGTRLAPGTIRISGAKKRWGSCGPRGSLNFSWRLVMAPLQVIDYVVAHELAHLEERNHSRKFWEKVSSLMPEYREAKRWLKDNQHLLEI